MMQSRYQRCSVVETVVVVDGGIVKAIVDVVEAVGDVVKGVVDVMKKSVI
jgi:hypothetical protein